MQDLFEGVREIPTPKNTKKNNATDGGEKAKTINPVASELSSKDLTQALLEFTKAIANSKQQSVNDTQSTNNLLHTLNTRIEQKRRRSANFANRIRRETREGEGSKAVIVRIPAIYKTFCPSIVVAINGCTVKIPADGNPYKVHEVFATAIERRLEYIDKKAEALKQSEAFAPADYLVR